MEYLLPTGVVFVIMFVSGVIISLLSTQLQCSKIGFGTSALRGLYSAFLPTIVYALAMMFELIRHPFSSTFESFGVTTETAKILGVGYLVMISSWVSVVSNINQSEKNVCKPDLKEMTDFKKKMMAELYEKEKAKQANAEKKT
jgi:F0F1-type ATP synthase assembly protein I